jgi:tRNA pseudouridine38-40 synthase
MRIALCVEYEGTAYAGWQSQLHGNTVQDVLEEALGRIAAAPVRVACAGRTDAGVHALAQVVHFDVAVERPNSAWIRGANSHLPPQVAVRWARPVADDFHARFCALSRSYRYVLLNRPVRPAVQHGRVGWFHHPLDADAMRDAARQLLGEHDFSAFRAAECQAKSPVKHCYQADVARDGELVTFDFRANAFLHHMVRNIVGALVYIGKGNHPPQWLGELLAGRDRSRGAPTFDPAGLYFAGVEYDPKWGLPAGGGIIRP